MWIATTELALRCDMPVHISERSYHSITTFEIVCEIWLEFFSRMYVHGSPIMVIVFGYQVVSQLKTLKLQILHNIGYLSQVTMARKCNSLFEAEAPCLCQFPPRIRHKRNLSLPMQSRACILCSTVYRRMQ